MAKSLKSVRAISNGALKSDELPSRIKVLSWGLNTTLDGDILLDDESTKVFDANQASIGRQFCPLDFNHNTVPGTQAYKNDKEPRAIAAYGVPTIIPGDGMYFEYLQWTPSGVKSARDYADLSPAVLLDEQQRVIGMHSCALTPAGSIENLSFYSADSVTSLMNLCALKINDAEADHKAEYGDVDYADTKNHKYPINTEAHVRAAWSYIHMPKNHKGYSDDEIASIKSKIAAKAKHYGIELRAEAADSYTHFNVGANAYVQDPYRGIDTMLDESLEYFRKQLGMSDDAKPDDIMKALRAKWEGLQPDKQPLPEKAAGSTTDKEDRGHGDLDKIEEAGAKTVIAFNAKLEEKLAALEAKLTPLSAELTNLKSERDANLKRAEEAERNAIVDECNRLGKVIPFSAEEIAELPVARLRSMASRLPANQIALTSKTATLKPLSADGKAPAIAPGSRQRSIEAATQMFADMGVVAQGPIALGR